MMVFCSSILFAQNKKFETEYKQKGELVEVTIYYEDGKIKEKGYYKNKKLHGEWNKFDKDGVKITKAFYTNGKKTGTWIFLSEGKLIEFVYEEHRIAVVTELKNGHVAIK